MMAAEVDPTTNEWHSERASTATEEANLAMFNGVFPHWNSGDIEKMLNFYHDDIVWRNIPMGEVYRGKVEVAAFLRKLFTALPDLELDVTLRVPRGKYVAEEYFIRGTHLGEFFGLPPTGRRVEIPAMSMVELRDGKLLEDHFYWDLATALRQMGLFPAPTVAQNPAAHLGLRLLLGAKKQPGRTIAAAALSALAVVGARRFVR